MTETGLLKALHWGAFLFSNIDPNVLIKIYKCNLFKICNLVKIFIPIKVKNSNGALHAKQKIEK